MLTTRPRSLAILTASLFFGCGGSSDDQADWDVPSLYTSATKKLVVEVDYLPGAEPYVTGGAFEGSPWDLFELNMKALFNHAPTTLDLPKQLDDMQSLTGINDRSFTLKRIAEIARANQDTENTDSVRVVHVLFLNGVSSDDAGNDEEVLGLNITGTNIVALFKPTIDSKSATYPELAEQSTLIHEVGHAVGLVGGIPMASPHLEKGAGRGKAHCSNPSCVMYWEFEAGDGVDARMAEIVSRSNQVLFGNECLADTDGAAE